MTVPHKERLNHAKGYTPNIGPDRRIVYQTPRFDSLICGHVLPRDRWHRYKKIRGSRKCVKCRALEKVSSLPKHRLFWLTTTPTGAVVQTLRDGSLLPRSEYGDVREHTWHGVWASNIEEAKDHYRAGKAQLVCSTSDTVWVAHTSRR